MAARRKLKLAMKVAMVEWPSRSLTLSAAASEGSFSGPVGDHVGRKLVQDLVHLGAWEEVQQGGGGRRGRFADLEGDVCLTGEPDGVGLNVVLHGAALGSRACIEDPQSGRAAGPKSVRLPRR